MPSASSAILEGFSFIFDGVNYTAPCLSVSPEHMEDLLLTVLHPLITHSPMSICQAVPGENFRKGKI